jgi:hypothetical protein
MSTSSTHKKIPFALVKTAVAQDNVVDRPILSAGRCCSCAESAATPREKCRRGRPCAGRLHDGGSLACFFFFF